MIETAWHGVGLDPHRRYRSRMQDISSGDQHTEGRRRRHDDAVVTIEQSVRRFRYIGVVIRIYKVSELIGSVSLVAHRLKCYDRLSCLIYYVKEAEGREGNSN